MDAPVTATALVIGAGNDYAVMVSCDLAHIYEDVRERCRMAIKKRTPDIDANRVILNATHTHSAPGLREGVYPPEPEGVMTASEYAEFFIERIARVVDEAWRDRKEGGVSWAYGHAVVGHNRRASYFDDLSKRPGYKRSPGRIVDGTGKMYGNTNDSMFSHIEGYEDHGVDMLFTWDRESNPTGVIINLACTSQEDEMSDYLTSDFWHEIRDEVRKRCGKNMYILAQCSAAGDQSPHLLLYKEAEKRMLKLRGTTMRREIGRRVGSAVEELLPYAKKDIRMNGPFSHVVKSIQIKRRIVTDKELAMIKEEISELEKWQTMNEEEAAVRKSGLKRCERVVSKYEVQRKNPFLEEELHVVRAGDIAFATNRFELYLDYGIRIKARSPFIQTFVVQLAAGGKIGGTYLPAERAVEGRGYGANVYDNEAGPEGGRQIVEETLKVLNDINEADKISSR